MINWTTELTVKLILRIKICRDVSIMEYNKVKANYYVEQLLKSSLERISILLYKSYVYVIVTVLYFNTSSAQTLYYIILGTQIKQQIVFYNCTTQYQVCTDSCAV